MNGVGGLGRLSYGFGQTLSTSRAVDNTLESILRSLPGGGVVDSLGSINDNALDGGDWDIVGDEAVGSGIVDADYELADLKGCEGLLDGFWDADAEGGYGVVCVLNFVVS